MFPVIFPCYNKDMTDPIDSIKSTNSARFTERVMSVASSPALRHNHSDNSEELFHDRLDVAPEEHLSTAPDQIDISLEMISALANGELPQEAITALESFAPIGELITPIAHCERVKEKGQDFITWEKTQTLAQALALAAS
jgi:hypothetical protein